MTVIQKVIWKDNFLDLCLSNLCAISAPGPSADEREQLQGALLVLHLSFLAADLSMA